MRDDLSGDYVECAECGHPIEVHNTLGCSEFTGECPCEVAFTQADIRRIRQSEGLSARY